MNLQEATIKKLLEAKQVGIIYHYTNLVGLRGILKTNSLEGKFNRICFTRDNNLFNFKDWSVSNDVKIIIDGNLLSEKYQIYPYNSFNVRKEAEERINIKNIPELNKYVLGLEINGNTILKNFKKYNYEFQRYDEWIKTINNEEDLEYLQKQQVNIKNGIDSHSIQDDEYLPFYDLKNKRFNYKKYYEDTIQKCIDLFGNVREV